MRDRFRDHRWRIAWDALALAAGLAIIAAAMLGVGWWFSL